MESWTVWSIVVVLFGMAGFWGGILQHSHQSAGSGGTLPTYNQTIGSDFTTRNLINAVGPTQLSSILLLANSFVITQMLQIDILGRINNNTGINQNTPTLLIEIGGTRLFSGPSVIALPTNGSDYFFRISILVAPFNNALVTLDPATWMMITAPGGVALGAVPFQQNMGSVGSPAPNLAIDNNITITATNPLASVNYRTSIDAFQVRQG